MKSRLHSELPTLSEASRDGWHPIYEKNIDPWTDGDRSKNKIITGNNEIEYVRYAKISENTKTVFINHGGPLGHINEGWRYLVDCKYHDIIFPLQYYRDALSHNSNSNKISAIDSLLPNSGLTQICETLYSLHKATVSGKVILTGTSWGATVSLAYATLYPNLIHGIVIGSPFIPTNRSIEHLVSLKGGFSGNDYLHDYFLNVLDEPSYKSAAEIFEEYYLKLKRSANNRDYLKHFSSLFYSIMGDFGKQIRPDMLPHNGITIGRALAFSYLASRKKPFLMDEGTFVKGLRALKAQSVPVIVIACLDDLSSSDSDLRILREYAGAKIYRVPGGHSSVEAKYRIQRVLSEL